MPSATKVAVQHFCHLLFLRSRCWQPRVQNISRNAYACRVAMRIYAPSRGPANRVRYGARMPDRNRRFLLRKRPSGRIGPDTFELSEEAVPEIGDGEALVRGPDEPRVDQRHADVFAAGQHRRGHPRARTRRGRRVEQIRTIGSARPCRASSAGRSTRSPRTRCLCCRSTSPRASRGAPTSARSG